MNSKIFSIILLYGSFLLISCGSFNPVSNNFKYISKEIGPNGGSIQSTDGKLILQIPAGALEQHLEIGIKSITIDNLSPELDDLNDKYGISHVYELTPHNTQFNRPVSITFASDQEVQQTEENITVSPEFLFTSSNGTLEYVSNQGMVVKNNSEVTVHGHLSHFSELVKTDKLQEVSASISTIDADEIPKTVNREITAMLNAKQGFISETSFSESHTGPVYLKERIAYNNTNPSDHEIFSTVNLPTHLPVQEAMKFNYEFIDQGEANISTSIFIRDFETPRVEIIKPAYSVTFQNSFTNQKVVESPLPQFAVNISNFEGSPIGDFPGNHVFNSKINLNRNEETEGSDEAGKRNVNMDFPDGFSFDLRYDWGNGYSNSFEAELKNDTWNFEPSNGNWNNDYSINYSENEKSLYIQVEYEYANPGSYNVRSEINTPPGIMHDFNNRDSIMDLYGNTGNFLKSSESLLGTSSGYISPSGGTLFSPDGKISVSFDPGIFTKPQFFSIQELNFNNFFTHNQIPVKAYNLTFDNPDLLSVLSSSQNVNPQVTGAIRWYTDSSNEIINPLLYNHQSIDFPDDVKTNSPEFEVSLPLNQPAVFYCTEKPITIDETFTLGLSEINEPPGIIFSDPFYNNRLYDSAKTSIQIPGHTFSIDPTGDGYGRMVGRDVTTQNEQLEIFQNQDVKWTVSNEIDNENLENFFSSQGRNTFNCRDYCSHTFFANSKIEFYPIADPGNQFDGFLNNNFQRTENGTYSITLDKDLTVSPIFNFTNDEVNTGGIEGFITHRDSPLPGASVSFEVRSNNNYVRVSGSDGHYIFENLPEGDSEISVHFEGFKCPVDQPVTIESGLTKRMNFKCILPEEEQTEDQQVSSGEPVDHIPDEPTPQSTNNTNWNFNFDTYRVGLNVGYENRYNLEDEACNQQELESCKSTNGSPSIGFFFETDAINNLRIPGTNLDDLSLAVGFRFKKSSTNFTQMYNQGSGYPYKVDGSVSFTSAGLYSKFSAPIKRGFPMDDSVFESNFNIGFNYTWNEGDFNNQLFPSGSDVHKKSRSHQNLNFTTGAGVNVDWNANIGTGLGVYWGTDGGAGDALLGVRANIIYNF